VLYCLGCGVVMFMAGYDRVRYREKETMIPWTIGDVKYQRYYYVYDKNEIEGLLVSVGFGIVKIWDWKGKDIYVVVGRLGDEFYYYY